MAYRSTRRNQSARGRRSRRSRGPVRTTHWYRQANRPFSESQAPGTGVAGELSAGPVVIDLLPDAVLDPGARLGATVERIHLKLNAEWVTAQASMPDWNAYLGLYVGPGLSPSPPPSPAGALNAVDWMFWRALGALEGGGATAFLTVGVEPDLTTHIGTVYNFDVKSKRRFYEPTDKLWAVMELRNNQGYQASLAPALTASVLIKR